MAADFAREKAALLDEELPPGAETAAEEAAGMPGWGSWTGAKKSARQKKKEAEAAKAAPVRSGSQHRGGRVAAEREGPRRIWSRQLSC